MIWLFFIGGISWDTAWIIFLMIYTFAIFMAVCVLYFDYSAQAVNWHGTKRNYLRLALGAVIEPFVYHPIITYCSVVGYSQFLFNTGSVWKPIARRGVKKKQQTEKKAENEKTTN